MLAPAYQVSAALPYSYEWRAGAAALVIIDMQNDFCAPGGFGERLGNDISPARAIIPVIADVLEAAREAGLLIVHTREGHLPDLSDCPPAKLERSRRQGAGSVMRDRWAAS
ncbi:isochorismatase family protein [Paenibacillus sp. 32O-W]|uniref:cysteine hydrolase family protein n=1 Tax=Paenibacillus sp. 32O-W TaxID=1695218 RepID=UPI00071F2057|nr:cysteine hydrolase family protein [Paenibacillus sp. 32O-W]ALS25460.1 isochorismatase family protein [Paenibacillus sp. 32O-W]